MVSPRSNSPEQQPSPFGPRLGMAVSQSTVAKHLRRRRKAPSQTWRTFRRNHVEQLASIEFLHCANRDVPSSVCLRRAVTRSTQGGAPRGVRRPALHFDSQALPYVFGAAVAFATFIAKEVLRDNLKDLVSTIESAQTSFDYWQTTSRI